MKRKEKYPRSRLFKIRKLLKKIRKEKSVKGISPKQWQMSEFIKKHLN